MDDPSAVASGGRPSSPRLPKGRFYLRPQEKVLLEEGMHPAAIVPPLFSWALLLALLSVGWSLGERYGEFPSIAPWHVLLPALAFAAVAIALFRRVVTTEYLVTSERVYARVGRLRTRVHLAIHDKITDIHYHQGILGRIAGYASLVVATGGGDLRVLGLRRAIGFKAVVQDARDALIRRLLREELPEMAHEAARDVHAEAGAPAPGAAATPRPPPIDLERLALPQGLPPTPPPDYVKEGERILWRGRPTLLAGLPGLLPLLLAPLALPLLLAGREGALLAPFFIFFFVLPGIIGLVRLRYTEYAVTDSRVYGRSGLFATSIKQVSYEKITDLSYDQNLLGRVLSFAGLSVNTAGSPTPPVTMVGLPNALAVKNLVETLRAARRGRG